MSSAAPPASINALPLDLLAYAFTFFSLRHRCLIVATICRRWRAAAYQSVTAIAAPLAYEGPLERFPNLTAVAWPQLNPPDVSVAWSADQCARIRSLAVRDCVPRTEPLIAPPCTALTSLCASVSALNGSNLDAVRQLLSANAASLTHLELGGQAQLLPASSWPALPSLCSLKTIEHPISLSHHLLQQLTHLSVYDARSVPPKLVSSLTALRHLALSARWTNDQFTRGDALFRLPSLTRLTFSDAHLHETDPAFLHDFGASVEAITGPLPVSSEALDALRQSARLSRVFNITFTQIPRLTALHPLAPQIKLLELASRGGDAPDAARCASVLKHFTALTALEVGEILPPGILHEWRLPNLNKLLLIRRPLDEATAQLHASPSLQELVLFEPQGGDRAAFAAAVRAAERRGMERIVCVERTEDLTLMARELNLIRLKLCKRYKWRL